MATERRKYKLRVYDLMDERGWTCEDLAAHMPKTLRNGQEVPLLSSSISACLKGNPSLNRLFEIAEALGVKVTELFWPEDHPDAPQEKEVSGGLFSAPSVPQTQSVSTTAFCPHCGGKVKVGVVLMGE